MSDERAQPAEAHVIFRDLQRGRINTYPNRREFNVSFRGRGGETGRRDFATHWIHWYPAKMFHRIPSVFLDTVELPAQANVLDPFCGSGTVLLEANIRGHDAVGIDINPLSRLISRVKTTPLDPDELTDHLTQVLSRTKRFRSKPVPQSTLDSWLSQSARNGLHRLNRAIMEISDDDFRNFFLIALTSIVRQVSLADPAIPPLVRLREERTKSAGHRYKKAFQRSQSITTSSVFSTFVNATNANIRRMSELYDLRSEFGHTRFPQNDADAAQTGLPNASVDVVITSPPYCGSQKYVRSMKLELIFIGCKQEDLKILDRQTLGTEAVPTRAVKFQELTTGDSQVDRIIRMIYNVNPVRARMAADYSKYLSAFAKECERVLRPGGHLLVTLGRSTLAGMSFPADRIFLRESQKVGLEHIATLRDSIPSRGLLTQRHRTANRIDHEYIVWMRQPAESIASMENVCDVES